MTTKHTPGPWIITGSMISSDDDTTVCLLTSYRNMTPKQAANAALIAAAPDLLAALTEAVKHAQPLPAPLGSPLTEHADVWPDWVIAARAAITRATGA